MCHINALVGFKSRVQEFTITVVSVMWTQMQTVIIIGNGEK